MKNSLQPPKHIFELYVAIPASITLTEHTLLLKTLKVGIIARALAIYRVDNIILYIDREEARSEINLIRDILEYLATPPYLRRKLIPLKDTLRYVGILPPLKIPSHPKTKSVHDMEYREGIVLTVKGGIALVDVGLDKPLKMRVRSIHIKPGHRIIVKIVKKGDRLECFPEKPKHYWCYTVSIARSLREVLELKKWSLKIATSRYGESIIKLRSKIKGNLLKSERVLVAFGSPFEGLWEIAKRENIKLDEAFHYIANTIPYQGTETVRTEEALYATLEALCLMEAENL